MMLQSMIRFSPKTALLQMILIVVLIGFQATATTEEIKLVMEFTDLTPDCTLRATTLYFAVVCNYAFFLYRHNEGVITEVAYSATQPVESVYETLDQGVSFIETEILHHFNSLGEHSQQASRGHKHYFICDELNVLRNDAESYTKFYQDRKLLRSLVLPAGLPYLFSSTRSQSSQDLIQILACTKATSLCQFFELVQEPEFVLKRMTSFTQDQTPTDQIMYTGSFVAHVSADVLRVYAIFDYELTPVYQESQFTSNLFIEKIQGSGTNNIFKTGSGDLQGFTWQWIDTVQFTNFQYLQISPRVVYDQHQFDLVFPYQAEHALQHPSGQDDLKSYDSSQQGIFMLGTYGSGIAVYYQPIEIQSETQIDVYPAGMMACAAGQFEISTGICNSCMVGCEFCEVLETCQQCMTTLTLADTGLCVCADRQYQNGAECIDCPDKCEECAAQGCLQCETGFMPISDGTCDVFACSEGFYQVEFECFACNDGCSQCSMDDSTDTLTCSVCSDGFELVDNVCQTCGEFEYSEGTSCLDCVSPCSTCETVGKCSTCLDGFVMVNQETGFCQACAQGTFYQDQICVDCVANCQNCYEADQCTFCADNYIVNATTGAQSCEECPAQTYKATQSECLACPEDCESCTSGSTCDTCAVTKYFSQTELKCVAIECLAGQFLQGNTCTVCDEGCSACSSSCDVTLLECATPSVCTVCDANYQLVDGVCTACTSNQYYDSVALTCVNCETNCLECTQTECTLCNLNLILNDQGVCEICPDGTYFEDNECKSCDGNSCTCENAQFWDNANQACVDCTANCLTCNSAGCLQCESLHKLSDDFSECAVCAVGTYYNEASNECLACADNCDECTGAEACTVCQDQLANNSGICEACTTGTYFKSGVCELCSADCEQCTEAGCDTCSTDFVLTEYLTCVACPQQTFFVNNECVACGSNCDQCTATGCTQCLDSFVLAAGVCSACGTGTLFSVDKCVSCPTNCLTCDSQTSCTVCDTNYSPQSDGSCLFDCGDGYYESDDGLCVQCLEGCATCTPQDCSQSLSPFCSATICSACSDSYNLVNGICQPCGSGTYKSTSADECVACPSNCYHCQDSSECLLCEGGYVRDSIEIDTCVLNCGDSANKDNTECQIVSTSSTTLESSSNITTTEASSDEDINLVVPDNTVISLVVGLIVALILILGACAVCGLLYFASKEGKKVKPDFPQPQMQESYRNMLGYQNDSHKQLKGGKGLKHEKKQQKQSSRELRKLQKVKTETSSRRPQTPSEDNKMSQSSEESSENQGRRYTKRNQKKNLIKSPSFSSVTISELERQQDGFQNLNRYANQAHDKQLPSFTSLPIRNMPSYANTELRHLGVGQQRRQQVLSQQRVGNHLKKMNMINDQSQTTKRMSQLSYPQGGPPAQPKQQYQPRCPTMMGQDHQPMGEDSSEQTQQQEYPLRGLQPQIPSRRPTIHVTNIEQNGIDDEATDAPPLSQLSPNFQLQNGPGGFITNLTQDSSQTSVSEPHQPQYEQSEQLPEQTPRDQIDRATTRNEQRDELNQFTFQQPNSRMVSQSTLTPVLPNGSTEQSGQGLFNESSANILRPPVARNIRQFDVSVQQDLNKTPDQEQQSMMQSREASRANHSSIVAPESTPQLEEPRLAAASRPSGQSEAQFTSSHEETKQDQEHSQTFTSVDNDNNFIRHVSMPIRTTLLANDPSSSIQPPRQVEPTPDVIPPIVLEEEPALKPVVIKPLQIQNLARQIEDFQVLDFETIISADQGVIPDNLYLHSAQESQECDGRNPQSFIRSDNNTDKQAIDDVLRSSYPDIPQNQQYKSDMKDVVKSRKKVNREKQSITHMRFSQPYQANQNMDDPKPQVLLQTMRPVQAQQQQVDEAARGGDERPYKTGRAYKRLEMIRQDRKISSTLDL